MSGKVKMKCPRCGKHFRTAHSKQVLCPECVAKERRARATAATASAKPAHTATATPLPPKIVGPGASILVPGLARPQAAQAPAPPPSQTRIPAPAAGVGQDHVAAPKPAKVEKPEATGKAAKPPKAAARPQQPRPPREKRPRTPPFELTDELRRRIEARYLELADPVEFDGIRTQIAGELSIPKSAVKQAVRDLRARMQLPSWWDLQAFTGTEEELARIRAMYEPLLPVPPIGVHKRLASELGLDPVFVYHGIRRIRAEMHLPQYNPPELHPELPARTAGAPAPSPTAP